MCSCYSYCSCNCSLSCLCLYYQVFHIRANCCQMIILLLHLLHPLLYRSSGRAQVILLLYTFALSYDLFCSCYSVYLDMGVRAVWFQKSPALVSRNHIKKLKNSHYEDAKICEQTVKKQENWGLMSKKFLVDLVLCPGAVLVLCPDLHCSPRHHSWDHCPR